jgi:N-hydroxyarylamine O-acetyltransferase
MDIKKYLQRIKSEDLAEVSVENLFKLQRNHLRNIIFENIDMAINVPISLNLEVIYEKVVNHQRGGVCYELNQLFAWLLTQLGYNIKVYSCNVFQQLTQKFFPFYTHIAIMVDLNGKQYLTDVGFSYSYVQPLEFVVDKIQKDSTGTFKITHIENQEIYQLSRLKSVVDGVENWTPSYLIKIGHVTVDDFRKPLDYVQSKDCARFYNRTLVIRHTENLILILAGYTLTHIIFCDGLEVKREDRRVSLQEARDIIKNEFRIIVETEYEPREIDL